MESIQVFATYTHQQSYNSGLKTLDDILEVRTRRMNRIGP